MVSLEVIHLGAWAEWQIRISSETTIPSICLEAVSEGALVRDSVGVLAVDLAAG